MMGPQKTVLWTDDTEDKRVLLTFSPPYIDTRLYIHFSKLGPALQGKEQGMGDELPEIISTTLAEWELKIQMELPYRN